jgi:hypothetical protein
VAIPQAASAANSDITITGITNSAGVMTVATQSPTPITSLTVQLFSGKNQVLTVSDLANTAGQDGPETWQAQNPITARQLSPGVYSAKVDATDGSGSQNGLNGGSFDFRIQTTVTLSITPSTIDYGHRTVVFSGLANQTPPTSSAPQAYKSQKILIVGPPTPANPAGQYPARTDASGLYHFTATVSPGTFSAEIPASPTTAGDVSSAVRVLATVDPIRLSAGFARQPIAYGKADAITGTLRYTSNGVMRRLPGVKVTVRRLSPGGQPRITATTNSDGDFRAVIPRQTSPGTWSISAGGTSLLGKAQVVRQLAVQLATGFRHVYMRLGAFSVLRIKACLIVTSGSRARQPVNSPVALQYTRRERGAWQRLATIDPVSGASYCPHRAPLLQATLVSPFPDGYYRLRYAGNQSLRLSVSKAEHLTRDQTRITSFRVTPRHVAANGAITISGRLWRHDRSGWHPYANRKVQILFYYQGAPYVFDSEPKTNARGFFTGLFTAYVTAKWIARYDGDKTHFFSMTPEIKVTVNHGNGNSQFLLAHGLHIGLRFP